MYYGLKASLMGASLTNISLDAYLFVVLGLVELVDDDDEVAGDDTKRKQARPINVFIKNSRFNLSDDDSHTRLADDPKLLPISIERLDVKLLADNQIVIKNATIPKLG